MHSNLRNTQHGLSTMQSMQPMQSMQSLQPIQFMQRLRVRRVWLVMWLMFWVGVSSSVWAAPRTWQGEIDEVPTWITVVPRGTNRDLRDLDPNAWQTWGNASTDAYVFAFWRPDDVRVVMAFDQVEGRARMSLYLNEEGAAPLDVTITDDDVTVNSNGGHPHSIMTTKEGTWYRDGLVNYNLTLQKDGQEGKESLPPDGEIDYILEVGEAEPGVAGWQTGHLLNDPRELWGYPRFGAVVRMEGAGEFLVDEPLMPQFPHFGVGTARYLWYERNPLPLYYHLEKETLDYNPMVGFFNGGMYRLHSLSHAPSVNFESPFAMYNFEPGSRQTRLVVRAESFPAGNFLGPEPKSRTRTSLRYSWKLADDREWAYGITVSGPLAHEDEFTIGNHTVKNIAPERLPKWVVGSEWPLVTFVQPPDGYGGAEGIYFYSAQANEYQPWLAGIDNHEPINLAAPLLLEGDELDARQMRGLPPGFRGQYNSAYFRPPRLYVSPIDRRLHLEHSLGGVWNLGEGRVMRFHNLNQDAYIDGWTLETITTRDEIDEALIAKPGLVEEALYAFDGYLIYSSNDTVAIHRAAFEMSELSLPPPTDAASWEQHKALLEDYQQGRPVGDMRSWLDAFVGETLLIDNANIRGVRRTDRGFHFTLILAEDAQIRGDLNTDILTSLSPGGVYALSYDQAEDSWQRQYATPARLEVNVSMTSPQTFVPQRLQFEVHNVGAADWFGPAELRIGNDVVHVWENLFVPGSTTVSEQLIWTPRRAGTLALAFAADAPISMSETIYIKPTQRITFEDALWLPSQGQLPYLLLMLVAFLLVIMAFWRTWKTA